MISKDNIINVLEKKIEKLPVNHCLDIRTYKRNRGVLIIKESITKLHIIENWFEKHIFNIFLKDFKKTFKTILKREFPRSRKVRVYNLWEFSFELINIKRKKI